MTTDEITKELNNYISNAYRPGALLITGKWGSGKTHFIKEWTKDEDVKESFLVVLVSLFDVSTLSDAYRKIKKEIVYQSGIEDKLVNINILLQTDTVDYIRIQNNIECACFSDDSRTINWKSKKLVLVLDDFERCGIKIQQRCGLINEFVEKHEIPVIIIANEEKIDNKQEFDREKEKIIIHTVNFVLPIEGIYHSIVETIQSNSDDKEYVKFLREDSSTNTILNAYDNSGYNNIRSLQSVIYGFQHFYKICIELGVNTSDINRLLYSFSAITYEHKAMNYKQIVNYDTFIISPHEINVQNNSEQYKKKVKEIKEKYEENTFQVIRVVPRFIVNGIWEEEKTRKAIQERFIPKAEQLTPFQKLTKYRFWELDQEAIEQGYSEALEKAYTGDLNCDELQHFLSNVFLLEHYGYQGFTNTIDYSLVETALKQRLFEKELKDDEDGAAVSYTEDSFSPDAKAIFELLQKAPYIVTLRKNQSEFLRYIIDDERSDFRSQLPQRILIFSIDTAEKFFSAYKKGDNIRIRSLTDALIGMDFHEREDTITGLDWLCNQLKEYKQTEKDFIKQLVTNKFIVSLMIKIEDLKEKVKNHNEQNENGNA